MSRYACRVCARAVQRRAEVPASKPSAEESARSARASSELPGEALKTIVRHKRQSVDYYQRRSLRKHHRKVL